MYFVINRKTHCVYYNDDVKMEKNYLGYHALN